MNCRLFICLSLLVCGSAAAFGASVILTWVPSISTNVAGYRLYFGGESGNYTNSVDVAGAATTNGSIAGLQDHTTYYFAATAFDAVGTESFYSDEAIWPLESGHAAGFLGNGGFSGSGSMH
jgi:hypothetical protein